MTTNVVALTPLEELPLSRRVTANIRAELSRYNLQQRDLAAALGISQQSISLKLHDKRPLSFDELATIASVLGMDPADFLRTDRNPRPDVPGGGQVLPRLDSNQQPFGYQSAQVVDLADYRRGRHVVDGDEGAA